MSTRTQNPALELTLAGAMDRSLPVQPEALEDEVIALFDEFRDRLLRYVLSLGLSVHDGEDAIQEVFLSLFRHLKMGRSRGNLRGWVFRVAHNLALKQRNRRQKQEARTTSDEATASQTDPTANPEEQFANTQRRKKLMAVIQALPEQDRWCLRLRAEGLRYREIAGVVGISLGAVSNSLAKSFERLMRMDGQGQ
jgi:RNA polymerase sigma-70 factor (ECF subfamily)